MTKVFKFGTFGGVFTPSILTILGVIMYLRLPMIVGEAGLWQALGIILLAHLISITTGLSISSIATDKKVEAGGTYYMISRSLGLPIGGTLGLALFTGLSLSVSLYLIGFSESFLSYLGYEVSINAIRIAGTIVLVAVTAITIISTSLAIKTQYLIMAAIVLSLVSILFGQHEYAPAVSQTVESTSPSLIPFMVLFGIFFPAVTGFEAGVSMSGDLKDPKRSIPFGSILAIIVGLCVYIGLAVFFAYTVDARMLVNDPQVLLKISWLPGLVIAGIWGATLSSALGSILGAPRILQATAVDKITPRFFSKGVGLSNEPRNALILTFLIAEVGILIGELNLIARVVSIFFITTYGFINLSCAFESWTSADFRPTFKTPAWISLLGAVACFIVMIELDFVATLGATVILGCLYFYLKRKELSLQTGDAWSGVWSSLVKTSLIRLTGAKQHTRNWRPNILMFNGADQARPFMLSLGHAISGKLGLLSSFELLQADSAKLTRLERHNVLPESRDKTFHHTYLCEDIYSGIDEIIRVYGFPGVEPNTVLMGWTNKAENKEKFLGLMRQIQLYNFNSLFLYHGRVSKIITSPSIDIWWSGRGSNLSLALNILRHLTTSDPWTRASVRICTILNNPDDKDKIERFMRNILTEYRTTAILKVIDNHLTLQNEQDIIGRESAETDLTIVGIGDVTNDKAESTFQNVEYTCRLLGTALFIHASKAFEAYNVVASTEPVASLKKTEWVLPVLERSSYTEINLDIEKIDEHGKELILALYKKVLKPAFQLEADLYHHIGTLAETMSTTLQKVGRYDEGYQKRLAIEKARKYFIEQVSESVTKTGVQVVEDQVKSIQEGILWYLQQIESDINRFPKSKRIKHERTAFDIQPSDRSVLRWFKIKQRILHPFSKKAIPLKMNFRDGAAYFFRDTRYHFLTLVMEDLEKILTASRDRLAHYLRWADESFHFMLVESREENIVKDFATELVARADALKHQHDDAALRCLGRLQVEYRKNVVFFMRQLERLDFNRSIRRKKRTKSFYQKKRRMLVDFPFEWQEKTVLERNTLLTNITLIRYYAMANTHIQEFNMRVNQFFTNHKRKINSLLETLLAVTQSNGETKNPVFPDLSIDTELLNAVQEMSEKLVLVGGDVPEEISITIYDRKEERVLTLPLRAMIIHLTETIISGPLETKFDAVVEEIKRLSFLIADRAKLAVFNMSNSKNGETQLKSDEEMRSAVLSIQEDLDKLDHTAKTIVKEVAEHNSRLKNALNLHEMAAMSGDFSQLVRLRKTRRLRSKLSEWIYSLTAVFNRAFIELLYSRTKGILLARQLSSDVQSLSVNERIIEQAFRLTPKTDVLQQLPHYYISLFNRRSSIGDNFWVPRPTEEMELEAIYQRYRAHGKGMILVLGEPNAGKSALCKHFARKMAETYTAYHVFPPEDGSVDVLVFEEILQKATGLRGHSSLMMSMLPQNSMIVFHDIELWWERSEPSGLNVIRHIRWMIDEFSSKCLFVANTSPFAYATINIAEPLDIHCAGIVRCRPFNSFELKQLVMTRHNSSGLTISFLNEALGLSNQIKVARLFNKLFAFSNGNPGVAMNVWLSGIQGYSDKTIVWKKPSAPDGAVFNEMPDIWGHICYQLLLHNRMSIGKLGRCLQMERAQVTEIVGIMQRTYLITECSPDVFSLNAALELLLINYCKQKEWIS